MECKFQCFFSNLHRFFEFECVSSRTETVIICSRSLDVRLSSLFCNVKANSLLGTSQSLMMGESYVSGDNQRLDPLNTSQWKVSHIHEHIFTFKENS